MAPLSMATRLTILFLCVLSCGESAIAQREDDALSGPRALIRQQKNAEAIAQLKALALQQPELKGLQHELGIASYQQGDYLEAAKYLEDAWKKNPEDHDAVQLLGLSYYSSGRPVQAIPALEKFRSWHPNANIDAIYILGLCYIMAKRYPQALQTFAQLYGVSAESGAAHLLLGRMLLRQGFDPIAETEIATALTISPQLPLAHLSLGEFHVYRGDYLTAVQEFNAELVLNPACAPALTQLGEVYWRLNRDDESQKVLLHSLSLDTTASEPYVIMGKVLVREGQSGLAEKNLLRAITLDPGSYTAHYFLGQLYRGWGRTEAAEREMKTAARLQQQAVVSRHN